MADSAALLQAVKRMDAEALARVFDLYAPAIYRYAFHQCRNAVVADQIVGDVFVRLLEQLSLGNSPSSNIRSYLFEIAYHVIVDEYRYSQRTASFDAVEDTRQDGNNTVMAAEDQMLLESLMRAIRNNLTDAQRHVIILRFLEGFSLKETALIMGEKVGNIKVIQYRAIAGLRKTLGHLERDERISEMGTISPQSS